jgi:hypothetical protein
VDDPLTFIFVGFAVLLLLLVFIGRRRNYKPRTKWRKAMAASLWAANAMLFGGVPSPVEKGKVTKVRKRDVDEDESESSTE